MKPHLNHAVVSAVFGLLLLHEGLATIIDGKVTGGDALALDGRFLRLTVPLPNPHGASNSVGNDTFQDMNLYGFDENQNFIGAQPLEVDILRNGVAGSIPARTEVASHYVFFDPPTGDRLLTGYVDFSEEIVAVITSLSNLKASDYFNHNGVNYLSPNLRGLEPKTDFVTIDPIRPNRLLVHFFAGSPGDYIRVLTKQSQTPRKLWPSNGHHYEGVLAEGGISWENAQAIALARGGYLVTIDSAEENEFVFDLVKSSNYWIQAGVNWFGPWLGGLQLPTGIEPSGGWAWSTGEAISYSNWAPLQPNNTSGNEDRVQFGGSSIISSYWNDLSGESARLAPGFIVEYGSNPAPVLGIQRSPNGEIQISWNSHSSRTYSVLWSTNIASESWLVLTNVFGTTSRQVVSDQASELLRFYRISY